MTLSEMMDNQNYPYSSDYDNSSSSSTTTQTDVSPKQPPPPDEIPEAAKRIKECHYCGVPISESTGMYVIKCNNRRGDYYLGKCVPCYRTLPIFEK
jgi:hypothetical protein